MVGIQYSNVLAGGRVKGDSFFFFLKSTTRLFFFFPLLGYGPDKNQAAHRTMPELAARMLAGKTRTWICMRTRRNIPRAAGSHQVHERVAGIERWKTAVTSSPQSSCQLQPYS